MFTKVILKVRVAAQYKQDVGDVQCSSSSGNPEIDCADAMAADVSSSYISKYAGIYDDKLILLTQKTFVKIQMTCKIRIKKKMFTVNTFSVPFILPNLKITDKLYLLSF